MIKEIPGWYNSKDSAEWVQYEFLSHDERYFGICGIRLVPARDKGRSLLLVPSQKWCVYLLLKRWTARFGSRGEFLSVRKEVHYYRLQHGLLGLFSATARCEQLMARVSREFYLDRQLLSAASPAARNERLQNAKTTGEING